MTLLYFDDTNLTTRAYSLLRSEIITARLKPDEKLNIATLCQRLGIGAPAVREALSRLTSEEFVAAFPQRGFRVAPVSRQRFQELIEARAFVDAECLKRAIAHGDLKWEAAIVGSFHEMVGSRQSKGSGVLDGMASTHEAFHATLVAACDNCWLLRARERLSLHAERYYRLANCLAAARRTFAEDHHKIMEATVRRKTVQACELLARHILKDRELFSEELVPDSPSNV
jgi:DNA-binding GntR family transcriptional regulator